jgi:flagellar hook-associated protein 2
MTNSINLAALGFGGIDTSSLVSSLVSLEQAPINQLTTQQEDVQSASASISSFSQTLSALKSASVTLSDPTTFQAMQATSSDSSVVATATGSPVAGQWSVSVQSVAQEQRTISNGTSSSSTALGLGGTLGISLGDGTSAQLTLTSTDTLEDVATKISSAGLGVQAAVMYDGSQYHLMVSGTKTGASEAITFDESGLSNSGYSLGLSTSTNTIQQAQDAKLTVGGVPITSSTNLVTTAIPGVSLALTQPTTTPATVTIAGDSSSLVTQMQSFVTAYNDVVSAGHTTAGYGTQTASNTLLQSDGAINSSLDQLGQLVSEQVPGTTGAFTTLASVGVSLNTDGTLTFDSSTFSAAVQSDPSSVERLLVTDSSNGSAGVMGQLGSAIDALTDPGGGAIQAEINGFQQRNTQLGSEISDAQQRSSQYQTQLQNEFSQMNTQLAQYKTIMSSLDNGSSSSSNSSGV